MSKILNLVNQNFATENPTVAIGYKISQFPDGQQSITINTDNIYLHNHVLIQSRMNSFKDVELIVCANQALREHGVENISLYVPYFIGARSDRKFMIGTSNYLKTVICPIINSQNFSKVIVLDPHSNVIEACLNNFVKIDNTEFVGKALNYLGIPMNELTLVSPDAGAYGKIFNVAEKFKIPNIITAIKHRDIETGNITHTEVPGLEPVFGRLEPKNFVIIDDICDGGRTFIEIAKAIRAVRSHSIYADKIYLIVTHGIFSAGFKPLKEFNQVICTNSYSEIGDLYSELGEMHKTNVKTFNIF